VQEIESVYGFWGGNEGDPVISRIPYHFNGEMRIAYGQKMQITTSEEQHETIIKLINCFKSISQPFFGYFLL
jgi:hypothetical protein